jgi:uncharacterized protein DUF6152
MKFRMLAGAALICALPLVAHHSFAQFDLVKNTTYEGTVVEYRWENPHSHIILKMDPSSDPATQGTWDIEGQATNIMARQGWSRVTYKPGDRAVIVAHPLKDGSIKGASLFYAIMPDGKRLYGDIARPTKTETDQR